ncbi:MAG: response regulator [Anaerolineae bacterium]|nr:response regulator [Anaerolineae bacterium]
MKTDRILLVDDDANILASLTRQLRRFRYEVSTAQSGVEGLKKLENEGPFSVIVSDYRMPGMDGIEFLSRVQELCPDTSRIMLTGSNEIEVAIGAVNRGNIFRFLLKPLSPDDFISAVNAGTQQYRLITAQKELMDELSVLQMIDRELNTNLDTKQAMAITLDWALFRTNALAGIVGSVVPDQGIRIMASKELPESFTDAEEAFLPFETYDHIEQAVKEGNILSIDLASDNIQGFLPQAKSQMIVPIRRESTTTGVLILESENSSGFSEESIKFLTRLCDHASIAIANAELYAAARAANQAKNEFLSFAAHELRNPLTAIAGFTDLLYNQSLGPINDTQRNILSTVKSSVQRMVTLISDLGDISRIESGHLRLELKPLDAKGLILEVVKAQQVMIEKKNQTIELQLPDELPMILADNTRTQQILTNLVSNANKYSPEGATIIVAAEESPNQWDKKGARRVVHIWVKDNGIGLSPEDQKKIFQRFFRSEDSQARLSPGTGLGLNITKSLVEVQGGRIWFESEFRKGSTFHFTVPVAEAKSEADHGAVSG